MFRKDIRCVQGLDFGRSSFEISCTNVGLVTLKIKEKGVEKENTLFIDESELDNLLKVLGEAKKFISKE